MLDRFSHIEKVTKTFGPSPSTRIKKSTVHTKSLIQQQQHVIQAVRAGESLHKSRQGKKNNRRKEGLPSR